MKSDPSQQTTPRSRIIFGCMRLATGYNPNSGEAVPSDIYKRSLTAVEEALKLGITMFDHADIYCHGGSEAIFPTILKDLGVPRESITIQSKCGMYFTDETVASLGLQYNFSYSHIVSAVNGSLKRLKTDYLDSLLLHRPDALMEPEEIARAFDELNLAGKVRRFGVSNHNPSQMALLRHFVQQPLRTNQIELHLLNTAVLDAGLVIQGGQPNTAATSAGTIEYCRLNEIQLEAWSPLAGGRLSSENVGSNDEKLSRTNTTISELAKSFGVEHESVAIAWLLRHPAHIRPIVGSVNPRRLRACVAGEAITLSREQWYRLYAASRGKPLH